ncbi:hypothetical protein [Paracoccus sp. M683]|uniref:hypothetical protein n=1 Tax=Paracoccus sp. M683 TaxID=2594268 RepID=UPI00163DDC30|nr:hypothetical protein [Paracoccus sp. M683]
MENRHILIECQIPDRRSKRDDQDHIRHRHLRDRTRIQKPDQQEAIKIGEGAAEDDLKQEQPWSSVEPDAASLKRDDILQSGALI